MELHPVVPFEPVLTEMIPAGPQWVAQVKWDGVRILTYYDGEKVRLFNRKRHERTLQFPELSEVKGYCAARSVILDGEIIALANGKPSFHQVMKRDGIRLAHKVEQASLVTPVVYMVFDILFIDGEWVTGRSLAERQSLLAAIIQQQESVRTVENFSGGESLFRAVREADMEGIVCKDLTTCYVIEGRDKRWQKIKNYRDINAVVGGVTFRDNTANALLLGLYDEKGCLWYIGHAGTGKLDRQDWEGLTALVKGLVVQKQPFVNRPGRFKDAVWLQPAITVKVRFLEWTEGGTLRQPSIQALFGTVPSECRFP